MSTIRVVRALALAALLAPAAAFAAGYGIYEQGAAALGMGGAFAASAHDATAQFYNPAALTRLEGKQLSLGGTWLTTRTSFAGVAPYPGYGVSEEMKSGNFFPPTFYWTNHFAKNWAYGVGVNAPFGLGIEWQDPETFTGRDRVTKANLQTIDGSFSLAWQRNPKLSVAVGANARFAKVELNNIATFIGSGGAPLNVSSAKLESDFTPGFGWHAALLRDIAPDWKLAVTYKSEVTVKVDEGRATFTQIPTGNAALDAVVLAGLPPAQGVKTELVFPAQSVVGLSWNPMPNWTYELDGVWTGWSAFQKLPLDFATSNGLDTELIEDYSDQWAIRVGAEHRLTDFTYRLGYYYDSAAAPPESVTPLLPDANRHGATVGLGMNRGKWTIDAYNLFLFVEKRSTEGRERDGFDGVYKSYVNALGANLTYHW